MSQSHPEKKKQARQHLGETKIPHNIEAERAVLGAVMLFNDTLAELLGVFVAKDFWSGSHQIAFEAMVELLEQGKPIDVITLVDHLRDTGRLDRISVDGMKGLEYLSYLADQIPATSNVMHYAKVVLEKSLLRETMALTQNIGEWINDSSDFDKCVGYFEREMGSIKQRIASLSPENRTPRSLAQADYRNFLSNRRLFAFAGVAVDQVDLLPKRPESTRFPSTPYDYVFAAIQERTQAPFAQCAQAALAAMTLSVQHLGNVAIPGPGGKSSHRPISNYYVTVAQSGERKSGVNRIATEGIEAAQRSLELDYAQAEEDYEKKLFYYEQTKAAARNKGEWTKVTPPKPPKRPIFVVEDPTADGIFHALQVGQYSQGLFTEEGGTFVGGYGMGKDQRRRTSAIFNKLWDASRLDKPRSSSHESLHGRRFSMHLIMQPKVSVELTQDPMLVDNGFTARCLVCEPESLIGTRMFKQASQEAINICDSFALVIEDRVQRVSRYNESRDGLAPPVLHLSDKARAAWIEFADEIEAAQAVEYRSIRGFASKAAEHALRLAAVFVLFEDPETTHIGLGGLEVGIKLARFYLAEQLRMQAARPSEEEELAQQLMDWIRAKWTEPFISRPDICKSGPAKLRSKKAAEPIIELCVEHGWLQLWHQPEKVKGQKRQQVFKIVRDSCDTQEEQRSTLELN